MADISLFDLDLIQAFGVYTGLVGTGSALGVLVSRRWWKNNEGVLRRSSAHQVRSLEDLLFKTTNERDQNSAELEKALRQRDQQFEIAQTLVKELETIEKDKEYFEKETWSMKQEVALLKERLSSLQKSYSSITTDRETLTSTVQDYVAQLGAFRTESDRYLQRYHELEIEHMELRKQFGEYTKRTEEQKTELRSQLNDREAQIEALIVQIGRITERLKRLEFAQTESAITRTPTTATVEKPVRTVMAKTITAPVAVKPVVAKDDLKEIKGVGPHYEKFFNAQGIRTFKQVAMMKKEDFDRLTKKDPSFAERASREGWVKNAKSLFQKKYGEKLSS